MRLTLKVYFTVSFLFLFSFLWRWRSSLSSLLLQIAAFEWMVQSKLFWKGLNTQTTSSGHICMCNGCHQRKTSHVWWFSCCVISNLTHCRCILFANKHQTRKKIKDVLSAVTVSWLMIKNSRRYCCTQPKCVEAVVEDLCLGKCVSPYGNDWTFNPRKRIWIVTWKANVLKV